MMHSDAPAPSAVPAQLDLEVTGVAHGGVFVARHQAPGEERARVVFVPDTIPGERVRVTLTDTKKASFWRAEVDEVLTASADRQPHVWPAADLSAPASDRPGGADFGHIRLDRQRALKSEVLADALTRFGGGAASTTPPQVAGVIADANGAESADGTGWRTRVSLHVDADGRVGPYAQGSHRVVLIDDLPLATPEIAEVARSLSAGGASSFSPGRIDLVQPADGRVRIIARPEVPRTKRMKRGGRPTQAVINNPAAREVVHERVGEREFAVDAGGFWQVHRLAAHTLSTVVAELIAGRVDPQAQHLDLYGGVGLFAATIGDAGGPSTRVTSVESDARATEHANANLLDWVWARAETGRVDRWLTNLHATASAAEREQLSRGVVLLDPPRAGAGQDVSAQIAALQPASVVYVACDPVAFARDLAVFAEAGYAVTDVRGHDLFPHSHHVEAVALLQR